MRNLAKSIRPVRTGRIDLAQQNLDFLDDPLPASSRTPPPIPHRVQTLANEKYTFDAICFNAGMARNVDARDVAHTKRGYELIYLNHLLTMMG